MEEIVNVKISIIGSYNIGKSTLVKRWVENVYINPIDSTIGAAYLTKKLTIGDKTVKCHIWDTAGSERFHSIIPIYLRQVPVVLICFQNFFVEQVEKWIELVKAENPEAKIYLVLTKYDEKNRSRPLDLLEIEDYANEGSYPFFKTSSITGLGVNEVFTSATKDALLLQKNLVPMEKINTSQGNLHENEGCCVLL